MQTCHAPAAERLCGTITFKGNSFGRAFMLSTSQVHWRLSQRITATTPIIIGPTNNTCMYMYKVHTIRFDDDESLFFSRNPKGAFSFGSNNIGYFM